DVVDQGVDALLHLRLVVALTGALEGVAPDRHVRAAVDLPGVPAVDGPAHLLRIELPMVAFRQTGEVRGGGAEVGREGTVTFCRRSVAARAIRPVEGTAAFGADDGSESRGGEAG